MNVEAILLGTLKSDGTLELDQPVSLAAGRVRVTVEALTEAGNPQRFWGMMDEIWSALKTSEHVCRSTEEIEAERQRFRHEWDERQAT